MFEGVPAWTTACNRTMSLSFSVVRCTLGHLCHCIVGTREMLYRGPEFTSQHPLVQFTNVCDCCSRGYDALLWAPQHLPRVCLSTESHTYNQTFK